MYAFKKKITVHRWHPCSIGLPGCVLGYILIFLLVSVLQDPEQVDREMIPCLGNLYLQINSLPDSVSTFCVRSFSWPHGELLFHFGTKARMKRHLFYTYDRVVLHVKLGLLSMILILHLRQFFIVRIFVKRATGLLRLSREYGYVV